MLGVGLLPHFITGTANAAFDALDMDHAGAFGERFVLLAVLKAGVGLKITQVFEVTVEDGRVAWLQGNPHDQAIGTSLCAKGSAGVAFEHGSKRLWHRLIDHSALPNLT